MKKIFITLTLCAALLCSCAAEDITVDINAPVIEFTARETDESGLPEYYLFDDNPEHLNSRFLLDGETPSSIAHFENLTEGIYTVFSYHHRGYSVDFNADLYYDTIFSSADGGSFEILNIGLDHDWNWTQAWADYTNTPVAMPEYLRTFNCTCGVGTGESAHADGCPAVIRDEKREPKTAEFECINKNFSLSGGSTAYLSEIEGRITREDINHFRYGGWNEPMWLMLRFKVTGGSIDFDTVAYQSIDEAKENFVSRLKGPYDNEPQYKGIAKNAPEVTADFDINLGGETPSGALPVTVKNMRVPSGFTIPDGVFATYVNTWREKRPIAAESDLMQLEYRDDTKLPLYGKNILDCDNVWRFDAYHTKHYGNYDRAYEKKLKKYGAATGDDFVPNTAMASLKYPTGGETSTDEFYKYNACNLGNFGVTEIYNIHAVNSDSVPRTLKFEFKSIAGQVYRYRQTDSGGKTVTDDGGTYIMKKFDDDPAEDPRSNADPKERLTPAEYGNTLSFSLDKNSEYDIKIEITTLTGCVAPMHNRFIVE